MRHPPFFTTIKAEPNKNYGKWVFFAKRGQDLSELWSRFIVSSATTVVQGVLGFTSPNSHWVPLEPSEEEKIGTISVFCEVPKDKNELHAQGYHLISLVQYTSSFGKLTCESCADPVQKLATIVAPKSVFSNQDLTQSHMMDYSQAMFPNKLFDVPPRGQSFAFYLGAKYSDGLQCWFAPNEFIWHKLKIYFQPRNEARENQQFRNFALSSSNHVTNPGVADPSPMYAVFSLNVRFGDQFVTERMLALFQHIQSTLPDIVCLQEMTLVAAEILHPLLLSLQYQSASQLGDKFFGEMLYIRMCTFHVLCFEQVDLMPIASMRRQIHVAYVKCLKTGNEMRVATVHLETGSKGQELRLKQLEHLLRCISTYQQQCPFVCCGDFNVASYEDQIVADMLTTNQMADAWEHMGSTRRKKHTWNASQNSVLQNSEFKHAPLRRFDRIFFTKNTVRWLEFDLSCREKIPLIDQHISDHFAVFGRFQLFTQSQPPQQMSDV